MNTCSRQGNCRIDADCGDGLWCSPVDHPCGAAWGYVGYYCRTARDECSGGGADCSCTFHPPAERWLCARNNPEGCE